ncbi:MAG: nuclear transport factor 2 family protein [Pyrinomonadaceae bacterium]
MSSNQNKATVREVNKAFEEDRIEAFLDLCSEKIVWTMAGGKPTSGKQGIRDFMASMGGCPAPKIGVDMLVAEDDNVVCHGTMKMKSESGDDEEYAYCDIYKFDDGLISALTTFVIKVGSDETGSA